MTARSILNSTLAAAAISVLLVANTAQAAPITYTDRAAFDLAIANAGLTASIADFDGTAAGTLIPDGGSSGGITFNYTITTPQGPVTMEIRDDFNTTSPNNYLGTDDLGVFVDSDDFNMVFGPSNAIGLYIISADLIIDGEVRLTVGGTIANIDTSTAPVIDLLDGGFAYFIGIVDVMATFTTADVLTSHDGMGDFFVWNADDIVTARDSGGQIPEPGTLALFGLGLLGLGLIRRRKAA